MSDIDRKKHADRLARGLRPYIVEMRDETIRLIGPFATTKALLSWAEPHYGQERPADYHAPNNPSDDPRWQSVWLQQSPGRWIEWSDGQALPVELVAPDAGPMLP
jgi:hypothetical protein